MSAAENIPFELWAIDAEEVGSLLGLAARTVLETVACRPEPARRRRSGSKALGSSGPDDQ